MTPGRRSRLVLGAWLWALAGVARALTVDIAVPDTLRPLLERHLDAARAARLGEPLADDEIVRLAAASAATARELLATEGYFSPRIEVVRGPGALLFRVDPGPRTAVASFRLSLTEGRDAPAGERGYARLRERAERAIALVPGMPFRQADWEAAKAAALRPFAGGAHAAARIAASAARIDPERRRADLELVIDPGPVFRLGELRVTGANRYPAELARRYSPLRAGAAYRPQDLLDYQTALESSGYYARAAVRIEPDPALAAAVPVEIEVVEHPTQLASVGLGASTDTGPRLSGEYRHRKLDGRGLRLSLDARLEPVRQQGGVELAWPRSARGYDHAVGLRQRHEDLRGQTTHAIQLSGRSSRVRGPLETTFGLMYQSERQQLGDAIDTRNQALTLNYQWTHRELGRTLYPGRGHVLTLAAGGALQSLLSDTTFLRLYARATRFFSAGEKGRVVLRGEAGGVLADSRIGIPTDYLFRAGGDNSVRGYAYQSLGRTLDGGVASVRWLATGSVEYQHFFVRDWGAAVFVDAGDAADSPGALAPVFGVGAGLRWRSPVGPINLDLAWGEAARLHFSLGATF